MVDIFDGVQEIDVHGVHTSPWETPLYKIEKAFRDGQLHAENHFNNEPRDPDWVFGVKSWAVNPYIVTRPDAHFAWVAGFCNRWGELNRREDV